MTIEPPDNPFGAIYATLPELSDWTESRAICALRQRSRRGKAGIIRESDFVSTPPREDRGHSINGAPMGNLAPN
jgi:hypothetical protein